jgi:hypothetical protein
MRLFISLPLISLISVTSVYSQNGSVTKSFNGAPSIDEKIYVGLPDLNFFIPLTSDLRRHLITGIIPKPLGRNGIRYYQNADMYTIRALNSGISVFIKYAFGNERQYGVGVTATYDYSWNFKQKYFKDGKRSEKTILYSGSGGSRINASSYSYSAFCSLYGLRLSYSYRPVYFLNPSFNNEGTYPYYAFTNTRSEIGLAFNLHSATTDKNQKLSEPDIATIGLLDKPLPKNIDNYNRSLFTNVSLRNGEFDMSSAKPALEGRDYKFVFNDLSRRVSKIVKEFQKLSVLFDSLKVPINFKNPKIELRNITESMITSTPGPDTSYINITTGFLQKITSYAMANKPYAFFSDVATNMTSSLLSEVKSKYFNFIGKSLSHIMVKKINNAVTNLQKYQIAYTFDDVLTFCLAHEISHLCFDDSKDTNTINNELRADAVAFIITSELSAAAQQQKDFNVNFITTGHSSETNPYSVALTLSQPGWDYFFDLFSETILDEADKFHPAIKDRAERVQQILWQNLRDYEQKRMTFPNAFYRLQKLFK